MEVTQIARDVSRTLRLNEDLTECIALAHDLGHPPFGHMGEAALDEWMRSHGSGFEHNEQSLRVVTLLEDHSPLAPGLNLNWEILDGLQKHGSLEARQGRGLSLEAQVVNICDEIAYLGHDTEDGLRAGLFSIDALRAIPLIHEAEDYVRARGTSLRGSIVRILTEDLYHVAEDRLSKRPPRTVEDVYA
jgi:dGTPase